jgi:alpha-1,2-mannosyltransferase
VAEAHQAVAPPQAGGSAGSPGGFRRPGGGWVLTLGLVAFLLVLAVYVADLLTHLSTMTAMRDLVVYRDGGLITRQISPPYDGSKYAPLYSWQGSGGVSFTYAPIAAIIFAVGSLLPWVVLRWAMTVASVAALLLSAWLMFGVLGYRDRRVRLGATLLVAAAGLALEPAQQTLALGQINLLLMLLVVLDLMAPRTRWWNGAGIGLAAGIKLIPLIFIPYLLLTGRFRQAAVAAGTFVATIGIGYAVLPHDSAHYWQDGTFLNANRIVFLGTRGNQSLHGLIIRFMGSVDGAAHVYLAVAAVVAIAGLVVAAALDRAGHPVAGMLGCALTALLVSPLSWDHHWVWAALGVGYLGHLAVRSRGPARVGWGLATAALLAIFGAWPQFWAPGTALTPAGWVWYGPTQYFAYGDSPHYREYHWNLLQIIAGNSFILAGLLALAVLAVAAFRLRQPAIASVRTSLRNSSRDAARAS